MPAHKIWPPGTRERKGGSDEKGGSGAKMVALNPLPHAPGARMTVVTQTDSNNKFIAIRHILFAHKP